MKTQVGSDELGKFVNCGKRVVPVPEYKETFVDFDVSMEGCLFNDYIEQLHANLEVCQGTPVPDIAELRKLLLAFLVLRVFYVNNIRLPFSIRGTKFCIPAFFSLILTNIGRVESDEFGLILKPFVKKYEAYLKQSVDQKLRDEREQLLRQLAEQAVLISRKFRPFFEMAGVAYATELPKPKEGNLSLMALEIVEGSVMAESRRSEPVFALMAAVLCNQQVESVIKSRINYGALDYLRTIILQVGDYERSSSGS